MCQCRQSTCFGSELLKLKALPLQYVCRRLRGSAHRQRDSCLSLPTAERLSSFEEHLILIFKHTLNDQYGLKKLSIFAKNMKIIMEILKKVL